jgi:hypothetical protein
VDFGVFGKVDNRAEVVV